jgi:hypothetical protein
MIRALLVSALAVLGLGTAGAYLGPDLVTGPRGEPLIMAKSPDAMLKPANFAAGACEPTLLYSRVAASGGRIVAFSFRPDSENVAVAVEDYVDPAHKPAETVILVFDKDGALVAAGDPQSLHISEADCGLTDPLAGAPV